MIDVNRNGDVWVFAEQHGGRLEDPPIELMSKARHLADTLGVQLGAVLPGDNVKSLAKVLIQHGADKVYLAENPQLKTYQTNSYAKIMYDFGNHTLISNRSRVYKGGSWMDRAYFITPGSRRFLEED